MKTCWIVTIKAFLGNMINFLNPETKFNNSESAESRAEETSTDRLIGSDPRRPHMTAYIYVV